MDIDINPNLEEEADEIDASDVYKLTESTFCSPRMIGTEGNEKCRRVIKEEFIKNGYEPKIHSFHINESKFSFFRFMFATFILANLAVWITYNWNPLICLISTLASMIISMSLIKRFFQLVQSHSENIKNNCSGGIYCENIYTDLKSENSKVLILFLAHYDTKSQPVTYGNRSWIMKYAFKVASIFPVVPIIGLILRYFSPQLMSSIFNISYVVLLLSFIYLQYKGIQCSQTGNESPGAVDNGTSCALVLELSKYYQKHKPKNVDLQFIIFDAEEKMIWGSSCFVEDMEDEYDKERTFIINFEMVGLKDKSLIVEKSSMFGAVKSDQELNGIIMKICNDLNISCRDYEYGFSGGDHMPFCSKGFRGTMITPDCLGVDLEFMHSEKDDMSMVSLEKLQEMVLLSTKIVEEFEKRYDMMNENEK